MLEENKIKDIFSNTSLENEDWLEPSSMVFQNIENTIYKNKRKRWYWLLIMPFLAGLAIISYWQIGNNNLPDSSVNETTSKQHIIKKTTNESEIITEGTKNNNIKNAEINNKVADENTEQVQNKLEPNNTSTITDTNVKLKERPKEKIIANSNPKNLTNISNVLSKSISKPQRKNKNIDSNNSDFKTTSNAKSISSNLNKSPSILSVADKKLIEAVNNSSKNKDNIAGLLKLKRNEIPVEKKQRAIESRIKTLKSILPVLENNDINENAIKLLNETTQAALFKQAKTKWSFGMVSGYSNWDCSLNNNYKSLLKSAGFNFTNGKGYFVALQANKKLTEKFSIISSLSFETVYSKSGHSANVDYNPTNENSEAISVYDLKMASTMGFIDANIEIMRQNDVSLNASPVSIDLNNKHKVTSIDFSTYLSAKIFEKNNFNVSAQIGLGLAQIMDVKNELVAFTTSSEALQPYKTKVTANQTELNKTRPFIAFGSNIGYQIGTTGNLFVSYAFKSDFNALYKSGTFSTFLNKHNIGLGYLKKF